MPRFRGAKDFRHDADPAIGLLITNLGTPDAPTPAALRRYLAEFLSDPRVIEVPRPLWWLILHGVILRFRPRRSARAYAKVWTDEGSPLLVYSRRQRDRLARRLGGSYRLRLEVGLGMRYGQPSIGSALAAMVEANVSRLLVLPLYPQYCASTTASTFDAVADFFAGQRRIPELRFVDSYHDDPAYIEALAATIRATGRRYDRRSRLLFSFHGIPRRYLLNGDPYHCQCQKTARLVAQSLGLSRDAWAISFQSRLGREEWLRPYTDELLADWARSGVAEVDTISPGFSADCLETLEELDIQYRELFLAAGGSAFRYLPALNDSAAHIEMLAALAERVTADWRELEHGADESEATAQRARSLGSVT